MKGEEAKSKKVMERRAGVATWRGGERGRAGMRVSISSLRTLPLTPFLSSPSLPILSSISKAAGALSSTTDKLRGKAEALPFFFFLFLR